MKKTFRIIFILVIVFFIFYFGIFVFVNIQGKNILKKYARENLNCDIELKSLRLEFPFSLEIKDLNIENLYLKKIKISLGLFNPFSPKYVLNKILIEGAKGSIVRDNNGNFEFLLKPLLLKSKQKNNFDKDEGLAGKKILSEEIDKKNEVKGNLGKKKIIFKINNVYIKDGSLDFVNYVKDEQLTLTLKNIILKVKNISYPEFSKMHLNLTASLATDKGFLDKAISIGGWLDYLKRDMDIKASINGISYKMFDQYYPSVLKSDNLGIQEALFSINSAFRSINNDLTIDNVLSIDSIEFLEDKEEKTKKKLVRTILALVQGDRETPEIKLRLRTKMDSPNLNVSSIGKSLKGSIPLGPGLIAGELVDRTKKTVSGSIGEVGEVVEKTTKAVGEGIEGVKELTVDTAIDTIDTAVDTIKGTLGNMKDVFNPSGLKKIEEAK